METRSQAELLRLWQEHDDREALDELLRGEVDLLARKLRARDVGRAGGSVSAADLAQEAALRFLRVEDAPVFEDPAQLRRYLWNAAWRLFQNRATRPGRATLRIETSATQQFGGELDRTGGLGALEADDQRLALELALNLLREEDREVLERVYFRGLPIEQVAAELGLARSALDMRLTRARRRLAERLVDWADVIG
jgi:RNA polymerase sigma-70 factor (ECF subfamily)